MSQKCAVIINDLIIDWALTLLNYFVLFLGVISTQGTTSGKSKIEFSDRQILSFRIARRLLIIVVDIILHIYRLPATRLREIVSSVAKNQNSIKRFVNLHA